MDVGVEENEFCVCGGVIYIVLHFKREKERGGMREREREGSVILKRDCRIGVAKEVNRVIG